MTDSAGTAPTPLDHVRSIISVAIVGVVALAGFGWFYGPPASDASSAPGESQWSEKVEYADDEAQLQGTPSESFSPISQNSAVAYHWCPTDRVINYRIDLESAEALNLDAQAEVKKWRKTFDLWSGYGYKFKYRGDGSFPISVGSQGYGISKNAIQPGEIAITYSTQATHPELHDAVGLGGIFHPQPGDPITRGSIVMDGTDVYLMGSKQQQRTRVHEAGHALGLGHVDDAQQLMYGQLDGGIASPQDGDIEGLRYLRSLCR